METVRRLDSGERYRAMAQLVEAVQELSMARKLEEITSVVRRRGRELTAADGATFVLREGNQCYYADEDAISPLWKGQRFPMNACVSGWVMLNRRPAVIPNIYADDRAPADAYRATFVKSMVMVPIRTVSPIGAIGNYWAHFHEPSEQEIEVLQALANTTAVAMENVEVYANLEQRVQERTRQLEAANKELEAFSYSVSHDLRAPLRRMISFAELLAESCADRLDPKEKQFLEQLQTQSRDMGRLIDDLLRLAQITRASMESMPVNLSQLSEEIMVQFNSVSGSPSAEIRIEKNLTVLGDPGLLRIALENLLSNAWKFSSKRPNPLIEFGASRDADGTRVFYVRDNGAGFDMRYADKLFAPFQRLHSQREYPGTGVGLATAQRILNKHGGRIWAESAAGQGATFFFSIPDAPRDP